MPGSSFPAPARRLHLLGIAAMIAALVAPVGPGPAAGERALPKRAGSPVQTTTGVPHVQLGVAEVPEARADLLRRAALLPGLDIRPTVISLPGTAGFWLLEDLPLKRPEVIAGGREFAHVHPDGSLHASLPPDRALQAVAAGWAVHHPWSRKRAGWDGFVMLFNPRTADEVDVIFGLVVDGYNYVTGRNVRAKEVAGG
ncbi:MAG: luciferase family protein [Pseudomonadota bacterium]